MKKGIVCSECDEPLVPYKKDGRMGFCKNKFCNTFRCGWCGYAGVMIGWTSYRAPSFWDWIIPKKIMESVFYSSTAYCYNCGRRYPSKTNIIKYCFWEVKVFWWRINQVLGLTRK